MKEEGEGEMTEGSLAVAEAAGFEKRTSVLSNSKTRRTSKVASQSTFKDLWHPTTYMSRKSRRSAACRACFPRGILIFSGS
jgi:hypothetical protein